MKVHKDAASSFHQNNGILYLDSSLTDHCGANAENIKFDNKDDGDRNEHSRNKKWRDYEGDDGVVSSYSEVFLNLMNDDESKVFNSFQKNALLKFGINCFHQANDLYQASFRAAIYIGDMQLFSQGLQTIADILMNVEDTGSSSGVNQSKMTIHGLSSLVKSAKELLKENKISEDEHALLLAATFSRQASMKLLFTLFHSPLFHKLVMENGEETKIGKGIILHCIRDLTLLCKSMELLRRLGGSGGRGSMLDQVLSILRDCKDAMKCDGGLVHEALTLPFVLVSDHHSRHVTSSVAQGSTDVNGVEVHTWVPVEALLMDECGKEFNFYQANNVIDVGSRNLAFSCISKWKKDVVKQKYDEVEHMSIGQHVNIEPEMDFRSMLSEVYYWLKGVCMSHFSLRQACNFLHFEEKCYSNMEANSKESWSQLLFDYSSKSGHVTNSNRKPFKAVKGSVALRLWHRTVCFAILFFIGFHEALASEGRNQPSNSDVDTGTGHIPLTDKTSSHKESSSLRQRSIADKVENSMHGQEEGGDEMRDLTVTTFSNETQLDSNEYIELNFTSTAVTNMSKFNIFETPAGFAGKNTQPKLPTQLKLVAQVGIDLVAAKSSDSPTLPTRSGGLTYSGFGGSLEKVSKLTFDDLGSKKKKERKSLVFKRMKINVPLPQIWKMDENGTLSGEAAQVWYGEGSNGTAVLMANKEGGVVGTLHDGNASYSFQTEYDAPAPKGNIMAQAGSGATQSIKYTVNKLNPVVVADSMGSMISMVVGTDGSSNGTKISGNTRRMQTNCDDVEGFYGAWRDTRGLTCAAYTSNRGYCSFTGANYGLTPQQACCACGGGTILIDVMAVDDTRKSQVEMLNLINFSIFQANLALSDSGTRARLRLLYVYKPARPGTYNTGNTDTMLNAVKNDEALSAIRNGIGADLVHLFEDYADTGKAFIGEPDGKDNTYVAFIGTWRATQAGVYLYAHEAGHNLGCHHDRAASRSVDGMSDLRGYNFGYIDVWNCFEDIMSYPPDWSPWYCWGKVPRILQYSNTKNTWDTSPIGNADTDCARAIEDKAPAIANYRTLWTGWFSTVKLCKHPGCMGGSYHASPLVRDWNDMPADLGHDQVSQMYIPRGFYIEFYEHGYFGGWNWFEGSPDFDRLVTLTGYLDDSMSSFRVRAIPSGKVQLCKHPDCNGGSVFASVGKWSSMPWEVGDNQLTMVYLPKGYKIEIFEHPNFQGWNVGCTAATGPVWCNLAYTPWDDQASSFRIRLAL